MGFTTRRGRPKTKEVKLEVISERDLGTPELCMHRAFNQTKEVLDICIEKRIITEDEHRAAVHFRWLYTIRFGAPNISALDINKGEGRDIREESEIWRAKREREYSMAVEKLRSEGSLKMIMNIAIFNHSPRFLTGVNSHRTAQIIQNKRELAKFREGLKTLVSLWFQINYIKCGKTAGGFNKILS
jgi:hypothetical protein